MNLLTKVEVVAEFIFTYFFKKTSATIQPVQVARELIKIMLKNKQVSISNVYVANVYRVHLNPEDYAVLESFGETFLIELAKHLYDEGCKQGYTFLNLPIVEIKSVEDIPLGSVKIKIEFNEAVVPNWEIEEEKYGNKSEEIEKTTVLVDSVRYTRSLEDKTGRKKRNYLEIIKGINQGKIYYLDRDMVLGRHEECDIEVEDVELSRRHLKLYSEDRRWFIQDLGSTNGTYVNKLSVDRYMVNPGDKIKAGQTLFKFNVEK